MSTPQFSPYKDELTKSMKFLAEKENTIFIGQQIVYAGNPMSTTLGDVPKEKMIEVPVMEESQMGMSLGLAMTDKLVITFYPRWDFLILAANQLINHMDKYEFMTNEKAHVIVRVGKGSDEPLDPGHQHKGLYSKEFESMSKTIKYYDCKTISELKNAYSHAVQNKGIYVITEYPQFYTVENE